MSQIIKDINCGLKNFPSGVFKQSDRPRLGRKTSIEGAIISDVEANPKLISRELAKKFKATYSTIFLCLHELGNISKLRHWPPHDLTDV